MVEKDYLGAWDLVAEDGKTPKDYTLRIAKVESVAVKSREVPKGKRKVVIRFHGARKAMIGNTTNCEIIENLYGPDTDKWVGQPVTLYQTDVRSPKGGTIRGIRVRPKKPTGAAETIVDREVDKDVRAAQNAAFEGESNG